MKLKLSCVAVALVLASSFAVAAGPSKAASGPAIAKVNGVPVSAAFADLMTKEQVAQGAPNNDDLRKAVKEELIRREALAQEAKKAGVDKRPDVATRMEISQQSLLISAYVADWVKAHPIPEAQIRAEYDRRVAAMASTEYFVRHIQTAKLEEAQAIIAKLQSGAKFADLAKDSLDVGTKDKGGEIGWLSPKGAPQAFGDAISKLEKGKYTTVPVQTQYGYHVIMIDDSRKAVPPVYEEKKDDLRTELEQVAVSHHIDELVKKAKVE